jgi:hypothetical protein
MDNMDDTPDWMKLWNSGVGHGKALWVAGWRPRMTSVADGFPAIRHDNISATMMIPRNVPRDEAQGPGHDAKQREESASAESIHKQVASSLVLL